MPGSVSLPGLGAALLLESRADCTWRVYRFRAKIKRVAFSFHWRAGWNFVGPGEGDAYRRNSRLAVRIVEKRMRGSRLSPRREFWTQRRRRTLTPSRAWPQSISKPTQSCWGLATRAVSGSSRTGASRCGSCRESNRSLSECWPRTARWWSRTSTTIPNTGSDGCHCAGSRRFRLRVLRCALQMARFWAC